MNLRHWFVALFLVTIGVSLGQTPINNGLQINVPGYQNSFINNAGTVEDAFITVQRLSDGLILNSQELVDSYVALLDTGIQFRELDDTTITSPITRTSSNTITSTGFFVGSNGNQVNWTTESYYPPGETALHTRYNFSVQEGTLGRIRIIQYFNNQGLDPLGLPFFDDFLISRGTAATENLTLYLFENTDVYGIGQSGEFSAPMGLVNSEFEGWAAGDNENFPLLIASNAVPFLSTGFVSTASGFFGGGLEPAVHPLVGDGWGPSDPDSLGSETDIATAMSWIADPDATQATIITSLGGLTSAAQAIPELAVAKVADQQNYQGGDSVVWTISVTNQGEFASNVMLQDNFPLGVFSTVSVSGGGVVNLGTGTIDWNLGNIGKGEDLSVTAVARLRANDALCTQLGFGAVPLTNSVVVSDDGANGPDSNPTNNNAQSVITLNVAGGPVVLGCPAGMDLGCNPATIPTLAEMSAGVTGENGTLTTAVTTNRSRCNVTLSFIFSVANTCGTSQCVARVTYIEDTEAPVLTEMPETLGDVMIACGDSVPPPDLDAFISALEADGSSFSNVYFYGDSLTDQGNLFVASGGTQPPTPPYFNGRFSSGPVWSEYVSTALGYASSPAISGGNNYAVAGARTGSHPLGNSFGLTGQVATGPAVGDPGALYFVWIGGNDLSDAIATGDPAAADNIVTTALANLNSSLNTLAANGARQFVILNIPDLSLTPGITALNSPVASSFASQVTQAFNGGIQAATLGVPATTLLFYDVNQLFTDLLADPTELTAFGITNTTGRAIDSPGADPNTFLFMDDLHPTGPVHELLAARVVEEVRTISPQTPADISCGLAVAEVLSETNTVGANTVITYTYRAEDMCGNDLEVEQMISFAADPTDPVISGAPADFAVTGTLACTWTVGDYLPGITATDNCTPNLAITQSPAAGTMLTGPGTFSITFTATDAGNNTATDSVEVEIICPDFSPASISGTKYNDQNGNGQQDTETIFGSTASPNLVLLVDASDSADLPQPTAIVGDLNADGIANSPLDVAVFAYETLMSQLQTNLPGTQVTVVDFDSAARITNLRPSGAFPALSPVAPSADINGNGRSDVVDVIGSLQAQGGTDYADAFIATYNELGALGSDPQATTVLLISDGGSDNNFGPALADLRTRASSVRAFGVGNSINFGNLLSVDPGATVVADAAQLEAIMNSLVPSTQTIVAVNTEPTLSGVTIYLDLNNNSMLDANEPSSVTDASGSYRFDGLIPGTYTVREILPAGTEQTAPGDAYSVTVFEGQDATGFDFFNFDPAGGGVIGGGGGTNMMTNTASGVISGTVWNDAANDATPAGDNLSMLGLTGVTVTLTPASGGGARSTTTAANGAFSFDNVAAGDYTVSVDTSSIPDTLPNVTTPTSYSFSFDPASGGTTPDLFFGFSPVPTAISLENFTASADGVAWTTGFEDNSLGYYVLRSADGGETWQRVNETLVLATGGSSSYAVADEHRPAGPVRYRLEEIDSSLASIEYHVIGYAPPAGGDTVTITADGGEAVFMVTGDSSLVIGLEPGATIDDTDEGIQVFGATLETESGAGVYFSWETGANVQVR